MGIKLLNGVMATMKLRRQSEQVVENINEIMPKIALFVEGEVKQSIAGHRTETRSVDTGRFLNSVHSFVDTDRDIVSAVVWSDVEYGPYLEYGTSRQPYARFHFHNTLERNSDLITDLIADQVKKVK